MSAKTPMTSAPVDLALGEPRPQAGAIAWRRTPRLEIILVTSRETGRWVIPKGGLAPGKTPWQSAAAEAYEEAGVTGDIARTPLGAYDYVKFLKSGEGAPCRVTVFEMAVTDVLAAWPEQDQRTVRWFAVADAAEAVHEAGLKALIQAFGAERGAG